MTLPIRVSSWEKGVNYAKVDVEQEVLLMAYVELTILKERKHGYLTLATTTT